MKTKIKTPAAKAAKHGEKMIEVRVRFFTNAIAGKKDAILPKHAWDWGMIAMDSNESHGIKPRRPLPFHSILELQSVLAKVLVEHGVTLHRGSVLKKLIKE